MTESIPAPAPEPSAPRLQLSTQVTAEFLARAESELVSVFLGYLTSRRRHFSDSGFYSLLFAAVKLLSVFGLILSLFLTAMGGAVFYSIRVDAVFVVLFSLMLFCFWNKEKANARLWASYQPIWNWMARKRANRMLRVAVATAPFTAEYDFRGDWLAYYRSKNGKFDFAWARKITGLRVTGSSFTLLFKKKVSLYPYAIVLHDSSRELETYMDALGIAKAPLDSGTN